MADDKIKNKKRKANRLPLGKDDGANGSSKNISKSFQNQTVTGQLKIEEAKDATEGKGKEDAEKNDLSEEKTVPTRKPSPYEKIRHVIITNDGNHENLVRLVGLKNLFAKQLPKMPKDYIVRLVFDRRHKSLAILSDDPSVKGTDDEIIGGICYRPYYDMRFGEIAFCAVNGNQQVKVRKISRNNFGVLLCIIFQ